MAQVVLNDVVKTFGDVVAVDHLSLDIRDGEFVVLVGPSGCGKTTTLNMVAGLIELTAGMILIGDQVVNDLDPKDRDIAMVFQNYALYPSKTVWGNLAFPLQMRGTPKSEIERRIARAANILGIQHLLNRRPRELSGGQQQRVALGRAIVRDPKVFLMDEPLSNLDAKLRVQMRAELKRLRQELNTTFIYVTHDQLEAMTLADKIAILRDGKLQQYGTPDEVFQHPTNMFVGGFIGSPAMNFLLGNLVVSNGSGRVQSKSGWAFPLEGESLRKAMRSQTGEVVVGVRHGHLKISLTPVAGAVEATIYAIEPTGDVTYVHIKLGDDLIVASVTPPFPGRPDDRVWISLDQQHLHIFDARTQEALSV